MSLEFFIGIRKEKKVSGSLYSIKKKQEILIPSSFEDDDNVKIILFQDILMILFLQTVVEWKWNNVVL